MRKIIFILVALLGLGGVAATAYHFFFHRAVESESVRYTCPMHPQVISDKPGSCPICGMTLQPMAVEKKSEDAHQHPAGSFRLSPERRQTIGVKMASVEEKNLQQELRLPGRIAFDQELYVTEKEYVEGLKLNGSAELLQTVEKKMRRLGISEDELIRLRQTRQADEALFLPKSGGPLWVYATLYEADLEVVTPGMTAEITLSSNSSVVLQGMVRQVAPLLDPMTKTAQVRIWVEKVPDGLRPETYVDVVLKKDLGKQLAVPAEAVLDTGTRKVVLVDLGEGYLEPREVTVGLKAGNDYPVTKGLAAGDAVVTSARFLLDSEAQIQSALQQFSGHQH